MKIKQFKFESWIILVITLVTATALNIETSGGVATDTVTGDTDKVTPLKDKSSQVQLSRQARPFNYLATSGYQATPLPLAVLELVRK